MPSGTPSLRSGTKLNESMNDPLKLECEWWGRSDDKPDLYQVSRGAIGIRIGDQYLTRLEDAWGNTVRNRVNACAYTLGEWLAGNWWRLRWEPETPHSREDVDWRMSHSMASAGGGFCWPSILFASDGETLAVASRPSMGQTMGPVRYLTESSTRITAKDFEREIDAFMVLVLTRLHSEGFPETELAALWAEVQKERADPKLAQWRRLEAISGYDPGEAPAAMIELVAKDPFQLGKKAVEEVAAHARHNTARVLTEIQELATRGSTKTANGSFHCQPLTLNRKPHCAAGSRPWENAARLARAAREEWGFGNEMIDNARLAGVFRTNHKAFSSQPSGNAPMPLALHSASDGKVDFHLGKPMGISRRFSACRLLAQWLDRAGNTERLIPAAEAKTAQQRFQRSFAQEFLCPFDALMERLQTQHPSPDAIDEAADHFGVSPLAVRTTLINKGQMDRESLEWAAA